MIIVVRKARVQVRSLQRIVMLSKRSASKHLLVVQQIRRDRGPANLERDLSAPLKMTACERSTLLPNH
ncbi:hypothetical protein CRI93_13710 [Longimonas halophila]|uniref:Uncharacterized protein n=1 Tax=Longimonas halophila TaxID=1469170 RepID=A0A2H3NID0_9BACT|nr:hypothetical protein CRI93_13710 [Longimonas halophila]